MIKGPSIYYRRGGWVEIFNKDYFLMSSAKQMKYECIKTSSRFDLVILEVQPLAELKTTDHFGICDVFHDLPLGSDVWHDQKVQLFHQTALAEQTSTPWSHRIPTSLRWASCTTSLRQNVPSISPANGHLIPKSIPTPLWAVVPRSDSELPRPAFYKDHGIRKHALKIKLFGTCPCPSPFPVHAKNQPPTPTTSMSWTCRVKVILG